MICFAEISIYLIIDNPASSDKGSTVFKQHLLIESDRTSFALVVRCLHQALEKANQQEKVPMFFP